MMSLKRLAIAFFALLFLGFTPLRASAAPCGGCHDIGGLNLKGKPLLVSGEMHRQTPHAKLTCDDCHKGVQAFPHEANLETRCDLPCHAPGRSHSAIVEKVEAGPHGGKGGKACLGCHNALGLHLQGEGGTQAACKSCHGEIQAERAGLGGSAGGFGARAHFNISDPSKRPICTSCHRDHDFSTDGARKACMTKGCHEGAGEGFGGLYDHGGGGGGFSLETAGRAVLAFVALILLIHLVKG